VRKGEREEREKGEKAMGKGEKVKR